MLGGRSLDGVFLKLVQTLEDTDCSVGLAHVLEPFGLCLPPWVGLLGGMVVAVEALVVGLWCATMTTTTTTTTTTITTTTTTTTTTTITTTTIKITTTTVNTTTTTTVNTTTTTTVNTTTTTTSITLKSCEGA